jgi:hypothetical protein
MRLNAFIQTLLVGAFDLGFVVFGIVTFIRMVNSQQLFEDRLQSIRAGKIQPDTLILVRKYLGPGKRPWPHVVFSSNRQPKVNLAVTRDFFNHENPGDAIPDYYFPDGYFIPENHRGDENASKWFFLSLGVLMGSVCIALALARATTKPKIWV